ncbi:MAG TPA: hypothetical protein VJN19_14320 [Propionibacteriaceae bacterium]|nr:hypothetical protein [Propionibacteriaceae bacterium]
MSMPDRRTVGELLADSEALARETLLDATVERAPAMVRSWNQLVGSAAELWAVLPSAPNSPARSDPMERLRAIGEAISRSVTAGHWPGQGPTEEHLTQIADNLSHAQHLVQRSRGASQLPTDSPADLQHAPGQVMYTLYVAAHGTVVALGAYAADLQGQAETAKRRRQPIAERPTALEVTEAQGMIARFDGFEHLAAAAYLAGATPPSSTNPSKRRRRPNGSRLPWLPGRFRHTAGGVRHVGPPKSDAGRRDVAIPPHILPNVIDHLERFSEPGPDGLVFVGPRGGVLSSANFGADVWRPAVASLGPKGFTFHGLRGVSATLAARQGATTKELMRRLGHTTADMAMRYQRAETDRDRALAKAMSEQVARAAHSVPSAETGNGSAV